MVEQQVSDLSYNSQSECKSRRRGGHWPPFRYCSNQSKDALETFGKGKMPLLQCRKGIPAGLIEKQCIKLIPAGLIEKQCIKLIPELDKCHKGILAFVPDNRSIDPNAQGCTFYVECNANR
jgi:hypothetical protein